MSTMSPHTIEVRKTTWDDADGVQLRARQRQEILDNNYGSEPGLPPSADDVPVVIVILQDQAPVACGGLRPISGKEPLAAEIKRMFTVPEARGREKGISDILMRQLESAALDHGWAVLKLETGIKMTHAKRFYERHGFVEIPKFGGYVESGHSVCYQKTLDRA